MILKLAIIKNMNPDSWVSEDFTISPMWRRCELVHSRFPNPLTVTVTYKVYCLVVMYASANRVFPPIKKISLLNVSINFERSFVLAKSKTDTFILACVLAYLCKITTVYTAETTITPFADKTLTSAPRLSPEDKTERSWFTSTYFYYLLAKTVQRTVILNSLCL